MKLVEKPEEEPGAHHCNRENISYTIAYLKKIESGEEPVDIQDWRTTSGVLALQMQWLLSNIDSS